MRYMCIFAFFCITTTAVSAKAEQSIATLYPTEEYCMFVPPPIWREVNPEDARFGASLPIDRNLALNIGSKLADHQHIRLVTLKPDIGIAPKDLAKGGEGLRRALSFTFKLYSSLWSHIRQQAFRGEHKFDIALFDAIQSACPRRALLAVFEAAPGEAKAVVISLITGNILAVRDWQLR